MDFDVKTITSMYNQYVKDTAGAATGAASSVDAAKDYSKAGDDELMDACKKFEAYFLEQCYKEMFKTIGNDDSEMSASTATMVDFYKDNFIQKISEQSTEHQSLGLAQMLYEQMKRNYNL